jgi:hypothetical protein
MPDVVTKYFVIVEVISGASILEVKNEKDCDELYDKLSNELVNETIKYIKEGNSIFAKDKITRIYKTKTEKRYTLNVGNDGKV